MDQVDVVYALANKSKKGDDFELRHSLRSLATQDWVRNVVMVGHRPEWACNVVHIPCADPYPKNKDACIINKYLRACYDDRVSESFVCNSDDHYILRPIALDELGPWQENPSQLTDSQKRYHQSTWHRRHMDTYRFCDRNGHPAFSAESHIPYLVEKEKYIEVFSSVPWGNGNGLVTHIYFNMTLDGPPPLEPADMTTRLKNSVTPMELARRVDGRTFFNHNNLGLCNATRHWLQKMFPTPSPWEV